jgi:16S rRNA (guanine527-N7)-methyltransferase
VIEIVQFDKLCEKNGLRLSGEQLEKLKKYVGLLLEWNTKINLISRKDTSNIWSNHILHSLSLLFYVTPIAQARILDLGTGGGLPGIPLRIARDDIRLTLVDSVQKKIAAVADMVSKLDLSNTETVHGRIEELNNKPDFSRSYDMVVSRAVAPLNDLIRWAVPILKPRGSSLVALKGGDLDDEMKEARMKSRAREFSVLNLAFDGSHEIGLEGKKIVIVKF